jgi:vacuolar-type H+-ATPase subunit I/STV1
MLNDTIRMNLQLFAEDTGADVSKDTQNVETPLDTTEVKTYTEDEVKKLVQSEADRMFTQGSKKLREKWEQEQQEKIKQAEELAKLSEKERAAKELEIQRTEFEQEKSKFQRERLTLQTEKDLISKDMPAEFAPFVVADTAEQTLININTLQASWQAAIEKAIDDKVKGRTPAGNQAPTTGAVTKEQFEKMNYLERLELKQKNLKLYESLL